MFAVLADTQAALSARNMHVQTYDYAIGDLSLDKYPVQVTMLPTAGGNKLTPEQLLEQIRLILPTLVDQTNSNFYPYEVGTDDVKWASQSPVGTVFGIDITLNVNLDLSTVIITRKKAAVRQLRRLDTLALLDDLDAQHRRSSRLRSPPP
jgi:hypothetical protein